MTKVHIYPEFSGPDTGEGGVRRVVEAQMKTLPRLGIEFVDDIGDAQVVACHIEIPDAYLSAHPTKPYVVHCHGLYWSEYEWDPWAYKANEVILRSCEVADVITAPTEWVAAILRRHLSRDVRVIPHGINLRDWQPVGKPGTYALWNKTRVDPVCAIEPLDAVVKACPDLSFVSTFGQASPNLQLTGKLPYEAGKELVRNAGVYLCTTRETFGIGTLEAMAAGVPVVGYDYGGQSEYIEHGVSGWLVEPEDTDGLAKGIRWALENRAAVSEAARAVAREFTWTRASTMYRDLYREFVKKNEDLEEARAPRVSIIVPAYKLEKYLSATLDSVIAQDDPDWECIVVDDDSPDRCGQIAENFAASPAAAGRIRVIHNDENMYLAESRNIAIREAKGRYILPLDADDMLTPSTVRVLADSLDRERRLQIAYGGVLFVNEDGVTPTDYGVSGQLPGHSGWPVEWDSWKQVKGQNLLPYASMYRRSAWQLTGGYRRRHKTSEDADFWTRLASYGFHAQKVVSSDTLIYRNREGSMSREHQDKRLDYLRWYPWSRNERSAPAGLAGARGVSLLDPLVTVVIPVGPEHVQYVQDAVDSVAAQTIKAWECIVVNDSGEKLELPAWVRVVDAGNDRDVSLSRNRGIALSRAPYYLPLDADDYLQPHALAWMLTAARQRPKTIVYPDFYQEEWKGATLSTHEFQGFSCQELIKGAVHAVTALTPVAAWKAVGGYRSKVGWEDWDFQLACGAAGFCSVRLAAPLFVYRKWSGRRRDWESGEVFQERKDQILEKWEPYFTGGKQFMACGCQGGVIVPTPTVGGEAKAALAKYGDAVMVEYIGGKAGTIQYRGVSGAYYSFSSSNRRSYVAGQDAPFFATRTKDFKVESATDMSGDDKQAVLTA